MSRIAVRGLALQFALIGVASFGQIDLTKVKKPLPTKQLNNSWYWQPASGVMYGMPFDYMAAVFRFEKDIPIVPSVRQ